MYVHQHNNNVYYVHYSYSALLTSMAEGTIIFKFLRRYGKKYASTLGHNIRYFTVVDRGILIYLRMEFFFKGREGCVVP